MDNEVINESLIKLDIEAIFSKYNITMYEFLGILYDLATDDSSWFDEFNQWCELNPYDDVGAFK